MLCVVFEYWNYGPTSQPIRMCFGVLRAGKLTQPYDKVIYHPIHSKKNSQHNCLLFISAVVHICPVCHVCSLLCCLNTQLKWAFLLLEQIVQIKYCLITVESGDGLTTVLFQSHFICRASASGFSCYSWWTERGWKWSLWWASLSAPHQLMAGRFLLTLVRRV